MKKTLLSIIMIIASVFALVTPVIVSTPTFAAEEKCTCTTKDGKKLDGKRPKTSILGDDFCECGHGESVIAILKLIVEILTIGVGILAAVGITITGTQYLTAGGNEEKTRKAKRRLIEIVIGIAVYVSIYFLLKFLIPGWETS